ncbi:hypothetical protein [Clostridium vincentii]|uniref:Uncharacterized protein n=1 Tax=Clostridium vincentii TaxID=52704 RepID=A0A2T0B7Q4_9CLOT|nr:hypothetical protein [Clostridium vincentii]PRR79853.1 hypothetical protein CLVI_31810 [Clostridium vincentii]
MKSIWKIGNDIVYEIRRTGNPKLLIDLFDVRTKEWKYHIVSNECGTFGVFGDLAKLSYIQGFKLIPTAIEIVNNQIDKDLITTALSLLLTCIETSNTTEIPNELLQQWTSINNKVNESNVEDSMKMWNAINRWYRIDESHNKR